MLNKMSFLLCLAVGFGAAPVAAYEPPVFPLNEEQLKAYGTYQNTAGEKAFAAGPGGQFSAQAGFASLTVAVRQALVECDKGIAKPEERCIIIDQNGAMVPLALQFAQASRADAAKLEAPLPLRDLILDTDAWPALEGLAEKPGHKAFAISLRGPWARAWEAGSIEEAEREAIAACDKNERAQAAKCFVFMRDGNHVDPGDLMVAPDLSVSAKKPQ